MRANSALVAIIKPAKAPQDLQTSSGVSRSYRVRVLRAMTEFPYTFRYGQAPALTTNSPGSA